MASTADPCESCGRPRAESYDAWVNGVEVCGANPVLDANYYVMHYDCDRATIAKLRGELATAEVRAPGARNVAIADTGDYEIVCTVCGEALKDAEPHAAERCYKNAMDGDAYAWRHLSGQLDAARARIAELEAGIRDLGACRGCAGTKVKVDHGHRFSGKHVPPSESPCPRCKGTGLDETARKLLEKSDG